MVDKKLKVLLIIEQCNPDFFSVPLVGYKFFQEIDYLADVTLVTHERNKKAFEKQQQHNNVLFILESDHLKKYYKFVAGIAKKGKVNWPLLNTLTYPIYAEFNDRVYKQFQTKIINGDYDIVHVITPIQPRYPYKVVKACQHTPFLLGPVNGGVPYPPGFREKAREEYAYLNFFRAIGRALIPGYKETYQKADRILVGSTYTLNLLKNLFKIPDAKIDLFYENGIDKSFLVKDESKSPKNKDKINLLFVGRLVPYKCADIVIEAIGQLEQSIQDTIVLTIVGDGSERTKLENLVEKLGLSEKVKFTGQIPQQETLKYYRQADIFCFPSIREFGGAVVLEAMACGLPCIVANNGGIGEYVTEETGFKIEPLSREYLTQELTDKVKILVEDEQLREDMSAKAVERAREFTWENKAQKIVDVYQEMIGKR